MPSYLAIPSLIVVLVSGCKIHRLPELPPERDPTSESAPVAPWQPPPDVLNTELSTGAKDDGGHMHHQHETPAPSEHAGHEAAKEPQP